ncbi:MAG TPA: ImmA/IrrE family metallo-endopeptidase [Polyangia bacterium]|nr:ImmA/IrrE family metallo-endopeptidase [Polyangia bacterium]
MGLGQNINRRRSRIALSAAELAALSGIPLARVVEIEGGTSPSTVELHALAGAMEIDPASLYRGEIETPFTRSSVRFRAPEGVQSLDQADTKLLARAAEAGRVAFQLQSLLGLADSPVRASRAIKSVKPHPEPWKQGYELGARAREIFDGSGKGLRSVQELFEQNYIHVAQVEFKSSEIEAASLFEAQATPVILLNARAERVRRALPRRAILAHELCHLLHDGGERDVLTIVSREHAGTAQERRANGFAPSFLAPGDHVVPTSGDPIEQVLAIARAWGLSFEGAVWHAKNLGRISASEADNLIGEASNAIIEAHFEPELPRTDPHDLGLDVDISPLSVGFLSELALQAYAADLISGGRAMEILSFG